MLSYPLNLLKFNSTCTSTGCIRWEKIKTVIFSGLNFFFELIHHFPKYLKRLLDKDLQFRVSCWIIVHILQRQRGLFNRRSMAERDDPPSMYYFKDLIYAVNLNVRASLADSPKINSSLLRRLPVICHHIILISMQFINGSWRIFEELMHYNQILLRQQKKSLSCF